MLGKGGGICILPKKKKKEKNSEKYFRPRVSTDCAKTLIVVFYIFQTLHGNPWSC